MWLIKSVMVISFSWAVVGELFVIVVSVVGVPVAMLSFESMEASMDVPVSVVAIVA